MAEHIQPHVAVPAGIAAGGGGSGSGVSEIVDSNGNAATGNVEVVGAGGLTAVVTPGANGTLTLTQSGGGDAITSPDNSISVGGTSGATTLKFNSDTGVYWPVWAGSFGDGTSDQGAATSALWATQQAGAQGGTPTIYYQGGAFCTKTATFTVPTETAIFGPGAWSEGSAFGYLANSAVDLVTFYESPDAVISNAFFVHLKDRAHVNFNTQAPGTWTSGLNITSNPYNTKATNDPEFDLHHYIDHCWWKNMPGDGIMEHCRGENVFHAVWMAQAGGAGILSTFDEHFIGSAFSNNGLSGHYLHGSDNHIVAEHSYNNGTVPQFLNPQVSGTGTVWALSANSPVGNGTFTVSGTTGAWTTASIAWNASASTIATAIAAVAGTTCVGSGGPLSNTGSVTLTFGATQATITVTPTQTFAAGKTVVYSGAVYAAASALTNYSGNPLTDTTNWIAPQRYFFGTGRGTQNAAPDWGSGYYADESDSTIAGSSCGANAGSGVHFAGNGHRCIFVGNIGTPNCFASTGVANVGNPANHAFVHIETNECVVIATCIGGGGAAYLVRLNNGATGNEIHLTTDGTQGAIFSPDTVLTGNTVWVDGVLQTPLSLPTGSTAVTQAPGDSSTDVATDAFVTAAIATALVPTGAVLARIAYNPGSLATYTRTAGTYAVIDGTNLVFSAFNAPASGNVRVRATICCKSNTSGDGLLFTVFSAGSQIGPFQFGQGGTVASTVPFEVVITGLTPGNSYTFSLAWAVQGGATGTVFAGGSVGELSAFVEAL